MPEASIRRMLSQMHPAVYAAMRTVHFTMPGSCRAAVGWPPIALHGGGAEQATPWASTYSGGRQIPTAWRVRGPAAAGGPWRQPAGGRYRLMTSPNRWMSKGLGRKSAAPAARNSSTEPWPESPLMTTTGIPAAAEDAS